MKAEGLCADSQQESARLAAELHKCRKQLEVSDSNLNSLVLLFAVMILTMVVLIFMFRRHLKAFDLFYHQTSALCAITHDF